MDKSLIKQDTKLTSIDLTNGLSLEGLSNDQKQSILAKLEGAKVDIASDLAIRKIKLQSSSADMDLTINLVNQLEQRKSDYRVGSSHETASGHTEIKVSRNANTGMLAVIVIIGIILIIVLSKAL